MSLSLDNTILNPTIKTSSSLVDHQITFYVDNKYIGSMTYAKFFEHVLDGLENCSKEDFDFFVKVFSSLVTKQGFNLGKTRRLSPQVNHKIPQNVKDSPYYDLFCAAFYCLTNTDLEPDDVRPSFIVFIKTLFPAKQTRLQNGRFGRIVYERTRR